MEDAANLLGLDVSQVMVPVEHLPLAKAQMLPAIVVTRLPGGFTHFVVVWRRHRRMLQIMDPSMGRRWIGVGRFLDEAYRHDFAIPAAAFRAWALSDAFRAPLVARLKELGVSAAVVRRLLGGAAESPGWEGLGALDAAVRMVEVQVRQGRVRRRVDSARWMEQLATGGRAWPVEAAHSSQYEKFLKVLG